MSSIFGKPKAQKINAPVIPDVKPTVSDEQKKASETDAARKRRAGLAKTLLTSGEPVEDKLKNKLGQ